jgi:hypothetical protein
VLIDNDWSGDPDGLVALAHHLLSPTNRVVGITSSFLDPEFESPLSRAADGAELARELVSLIGLPASPLVHAGAEGPFGFGDSRTAAAEVIVAEARRDDVLPLYLVCGGPLTNVAEALQQAPDIAERLTLVWVGDSLNPRAFEYNRDTDPAAAEFVSSRPGLDIASFPLETYRRCAYSVAEMEEDLGGSGTIGRWLWNRFVSLPLPDFVHVRGVWPLGDSPPVLITALTDTSSLSTVSAADRQQGTRCVYTDIDFRLIVSDMLAKLRRHSPSTTPGGSHAPRARS